MPPRVASVLPVFVPASKTGDVGSHRFGQIDLRRVAVWPNVFVEDSQRWTARVRGARPCVRREP